MAAFCCAKKIEISLFLITKLSGVCEIFISNILWNIYK